MISDHKRSTMKAIRRSHHQHDHDHQHSSPTTASSSSNPASSSSSSSLPSWIHLRSVLLIVAQSSASSSPSSTTSSSPRGSIKSPWSNKRRKHALLPKQWKSLFTPEGKLIDGGVKFLKKVRSGGVDPRIRAEVWPFLLGVYDVKSSEEERESIRMQKRKEYESLRRRCRLLMKYIHKNPKESSGNSSKTSSRELTQSRELSCSQELCQSRELCCSQELSQSHELSCSQELTQSRELNCSQELTQSHEIDCSQELTQSWELSRILDSSILEEESDISRPLSTEGEWHGDECSDQPIYDESPKYVDSVCQKDGDVNIPSSECFSGEKSVLTFEGALSGETVSTESDSSEELQPLFVSRELEGNDFTEGFRQNPSFFEKESDFRTHIHEDFPQWQRIIRLDAIRANDEGISYSASLASVSLMKARKLARSVRLEDYDQLEPCKINHAARLVGILEAYALYDPEIGYCQGMSDLLNPIISVIEEDYEAFWCFVGFMKKARHNFRLDEVGIRRQLDIVSKIIKSKDIQLYRHLEKLQAEDCFFLYRMVVVLFRRELMFEQILCLWEVMWADQAAIRAGITKSAWGKMRLKAPPTDDLLLYAIAASVLKRRKLIIEMYSSMEEIMRECQSMAGHLDVWKLLDDAHDLVVTLHEKIE